MSNVLQLFKIENPPDPKTIVAIAVASILSSKDHLARKVEELSNHLDSVSDTIDALGDTDPRNWVMHAAKLNRESEEGNARTFPSSRKIVDYTTKLAQAVARRPGQTVNQDQPETVGQES